MKILLINNNPVVSRLTALSARKEEVEIDEIQEVTELNSDKYDIVFVDGDSLSKDVRDVISENMKVQKSVLFYTEEDKADQNSFDMTILKPFLPSEVSAVIRSIEESQVVETPVVEEENFDVLNNSEITEREELFTLDTKDSEIEKEEAISLDLNNDFDMGKSLDDKEDLSLELNSEPENDINFDKKLEEAFPLKKDVLEEELFSEKLNKEETELDLFELDLNDDKLSFEDELFSKKDGLDINLDESKEIKIDEDLLSNDKPLDLDLNNDEFDLNSNLLDEVPTENLKEKVEGEKAEMTQILDETEIANIKDILEDDSAVSQEMNLDELMTPVATAMPLMDDIVSASKKESEKVEKSVETSTKASEYSDVSEEKTTVSSDHQSDILLKSVANMSVETLRELLAGSEINISIKFPEATK